MNIAQVLLYNRRRILPKIYKFVKILISKYIIIYLIQLLITHELYIFII